MPYKDFSPFKWASVEFHASFRDGKVNQSFSKKTELTPVLGFVNDSQVSSFFSPMNPKGPST